MFEFRSTPIMLISFYCFFFGLFLFSMTVNAIIGNNGALSNPDPVLWLPVAAYFILACLLIAVGIGILYLNQLCWKMLFFFLMISISTVASFFLVALLLLVADMHLFYKIYQGINIGLPAWFSFTGFFLSGIIVLYYLTHRKVVSHFGGMDDLVTPF